MAAPSVSGASASILSVVTIQGMPGGRASGGRMTHAAMSTGAGSNTFEKSVRARLHQAEDILEQVPGAEMVKFAKNGSDAHPAEIKLERRRPVGIAL